MLVKKPSSGTPASGALDSLGFVYPAGAPAEEARKSSQPPMDLGKMFPPIAPPGHNPAYKVNLDHEYLAGEIDPDRIFLPSFDSNDVLCKSCANGLVIKSVHPGNRKEDGSPFTRTVGFCLAPNGDPVELDDFRPIECSQYVKKPSPEKTTLSMIGATKSIKLMTSKKKKFDKKGNTV
jgi:hypothetical protein